MKLAFSILGISFVVAVVFSLLLNWANEQEEKKHEKNIKRLSKKHIHLNQYDIHPSLMCRDINNREELADMWEKELKKKLP